MTRYSLIALALVLTACANPPPSVVSQSPLGITIQARKALDLGNDIPNRDRYIASVAQQHCASHGKTAVMTMRDASGEGPGWVTTAFDCR
jgi:putative hemolysin